MSEINVTLFRRKGQKVHQMQYRDPDSGNKVRKSTGTTKLRDAERAAARWHDEILDGRSRKRLGQMPWAEFRTTYELEVLDSLADRTADKVCGVFNVIEEVIAPARLSSLDANAMSKYQSELRTRGRKESTIKGHLAHLMAALNWAKSQGLIRDVPNVKMPKRAKASKVMKGRAITGEEFDRMLLATEKVLVPGIKATNSQVLNERELRVQQVVESWKHYQRGLWWSGLRLTESMELHWTDRTKLCVLDLDTRAPMLWVPGELEKGNEDRILAMAPEFAEFLRKTPENERTGFVFNPLARRARYEERLSAQRVGEVVVDIGKKAGVVVDKDVKTAKVKHASAHDLRRSFGERWAVKVMPQVLMELMRHESIETTMRFYVGRNARRTASVLWEAYQPNTDVGADLGAASESPTREPLEKKGG